MQNDLLTDYLHSIGRVKLLTAEEEIYLGHRVQDMLEIIRTKPKDDWTPTDHRIVKRGQRSKNKMVESNLRLVVSCAKKYTNACNGMPMEDLISEGNIGLMRAVEKFDPTRGYKFSTYAYWWIRQGINRAISYYSRTIRLPANAPPVLKMAREYIANCKEQGNKAPTLAEIAKHCNTSVDALKGYMPHMQGCSSLDDRASSGATGFSKSSMSNLIDLIADPESADDDPLETLDMEERQQLLAIIDTLSDRYKQVIELKYGLNGKEEHTLAAIAAIQGKSRESLRQTEMRILSSLRLKISRDDSIKKIYA